MPDLKANEEHKNLDVINQALSTGEMQRAADLLNSFHPAEIAHLLEALPQSKRTFIWNMLDHEDDGEILVYVGDEVRNGLINVMNKEQLIAATEGLEHDDLADLLADLPDAVTDEALSNLNISDRERLQSVLSYEEDSAGGIMNTDTVTVRKDISLDVVQRYLRSRKELPASTDSLFVVDRYQKYIGSISLTDILTHDTKMFVRDLMQDNIEPILASEPEADVAHKFETLDLVSAPVVDENQKLLGRITIDDVVDIIREQGERSMMNMAGLTEEEDLFAPILKSTKRRAVWLGVNMCTAFITASVINFFSDTLEQIIILAVLAPVVQSMGGIAGSQTLILVIRGYALKQIGRSNARILLLREIAIGLLNGVIWATVVALIAAIWFHNISVSGIIAIAMVTNLISAALAGVIIPMTMRKLGIDPALAGGVVLTAITDVVGISSFLGLGTWLLL
ncbi:MAG: magnesium transporter [Pseudomonadota bacterium]